MNLAQSQSVPVTLCHEMHAQALERLFARFDLLLTWVADGEAIPGTFWGEPEAGLVANRLYLRGDTPVHSALHEACHYVCMSPRRRAGLHTDAGGGYDEENAVCYLQITLADELPGLNSWQLMTDMDNWGYTFRLGSARAWYERDAQDALQWLTDYGILDNAKRPTWRLRCHEANAATGDNDGI